MSYEIHADHSQQFLLPPSLEDWVPENHPVRFVRDFVTELDLEALGFHRRWSEKGRPSYSSELLLSVWLYCYMEKIRSSRKAEHACCTHLPLIWLTGMNYPDHNSLWRFWRAHRKALRNVFRQSVSVAQRLGLVGMVTHALDGTKIQVRSSKKGALHRADLEALRDAIDASIQAMETAIESEPADSASTALPEKLREQSHRRAAIQGALSTLDELGQKHHLPGEPDARLMKQSTGRTGWSYNAQAVVDASNGIVVAEAVTNEAGDYRQLTPMLEQARANTGGVADATVADAGYRNAGQEADAHAEGHTVIVPEHGREKDDGSPYHRSRFTYDEERDVYVCPQGGDLPYKRTIPARGNKPTTRVYQGLECKRCPVRDQCTRNRSGRTINRDTNAAFREEQQARRARPEYQELMRQRKAIVEPLFGHLKENAAFRRWTARGLENAEAQWTVLCTITNLKKMYKRWRRIRGPLNPRNPHRGSPTFAT